jgi:aspartate carbamoyltransferase catalytic subunit
MGVTTMDSTTTTLLDDATAASDGGGAASKPAAEDVTFPENLVGIRTLEADQIRLVLDTAEHFRAISERPIKKVPALRGKTIVNLFFEPSTRTRTSFEIAGKRLSADIQSISASTSSVVKGETLLDTARNIEAMLPDILVIRHASAGAADFLAKHCSAAVVNAGDGAHDHPTQALLDALTIRRSKGTVAGLRVVIVGDIGHSRVARSNILCLRKLGAEVAIAAPPTLMPAEAEALGVTVHQRIESALEGADIVMMLRIQVERGGKLNVPSTAEYFKLFGLTERRLGLARDDAIVMHPGPINRGVEIASDVADGPRSVILEQVTNGLAVRMAILYLLAGGNPTNVESAA